MLQVGQEAPAFVRRPIFGEPVDVPGGLSEGPMVLVFVRYLGCPYCRESLHELQERFADFDRAGVQVAAITQTPLDTARDFVPRHQLLFPLVADPTGELQALYQLGSDRGFMCTVKGLLDVPVGRTLRAVKRGHGRFEGPETQLAAEFVVDRDGRLARVDYACSVFAAPDWDGLLACASSL